MIRHHRIRALRELQGLTQEELARKVGVSRQSVAAWERGEAIPNLENLILLARALGVPFETFLGSGEDKAELSFLFRAESLVMTRDVLPGYDQKALEYAEPENMLGDMLAGYAKKALEYAELENMLGEAPELPPQFPGFDARPEFVEKAARSIREWLGVGAGVLHDVFGRLEDKGFKIFFEPLLPDISGFSAYSPDFGVAFFINRNHPGERQIFTALHELGHLVFHRNEYSSSGVLVLSKDDPREQGANRFAAAVLLPPETVREELHPVGRKLSFPLLRQLKRKYSVSIRTLVRRAADVGLIDKSRADWYRRWLDERYGPTGEPDQLPSFVESPRFKRLVVLAVSREKISRSRAVELLGISMLELDELIRDWPEQELSPVESDR